MSKEVIETYQQKAPKYRKILWSLVVLLLVIITLNLSFGSESIIALIVTAVMLLTVVFLMLSSKKYYNWTLPFIGIFFLGIFFKMNHLAGAGVMITTSCIMVFFNLLFFSVKSFFVLKHNMFLKWFSFFTGIALALFMYSFMSKIQHWPLFMPFWIFKYSINLMLIILSLVLIFKLPGLNFASWQQFDRIVFYRQILLPLVIIFAFNLIIFVNPYFIEAIFTRGWEIHPWGMYGIELHDFEGL